MGRRRKNRGIEPEKMHRLEAIVAEHETGLLRYATRILRNPDDAQDVVQNTFIKLSKVWENGSRPTDRMRSWLYRVTHNGAVDHIRRESRLRLFKDRQKEEQEVLEPHRPAHDSARREQLELVIHHLDRLDDRERQVVLLRLEEGLSYKEIAAVTGRTPGNVGCVLHHAVKKLSRSLQQAGALRG